MMTVMTKKYKHSSCKSVRKGAWTREEDELLKRCVERYGEGKWKMVPGRAGLNRCRKSCRLRWLNYLHPNIKRGHFSVDEIDLILRLHRLLGNRWALIAGRIPGRTANDIKNYWNSHLCKNLISEGKLLSTTAANLLSDYHHIDAQPSSAPMDSAECLEVSSSIGCNKLVVEQQQPLSSKGQEDEEEKGESLSFWKNLLFSGEELEASMSFQNSDEELTLNIDGDHLDFSLDFSFDDLFKDIEIWDISYDQQMMPPH